jgi:signal transduction histidine kinase
MSAARRLLARVDVRLALQLAGVTAAFTAALLCGLLAYAVMESLEVQAASLDRLIARLDSAAAGAPVLALPVGSAYRVRDAEGRNVAAEGRWPADDRARRTVTVWSALGARSNEYLVRERARSAGGSIAAAAPLAHFVRERRELADRAVLVVLLGLVGSVVLGIVNARRALRPLRDTTAAIRAIDPGRLAARIPLRGAGDDVDGLAIATNEVLERLEWAFGRLAAFSADAAHELRTPVNRILNTAEVALTTTTDPVAKDDALANVRDTADAMRRTIEQLLLLARGEDGGLRLVRDDVDLGTLVAGLGDLYAPEAERLDKRLVVTPSTARIRADRELVERAVANLVENALAHTQPGATIRVGVERRHDRAAVVVEDSGPGISAADRTRIFERFVRLDGGRDGTGAGLGLPIARMVARLHGGDLDVDAAALGGAAFRLSLLAAG